MAHTPHTFIASYIVCKKGDSVLLQRRFQTGFNDGKYSLPAGHVEAGENFTQALYREIKEEIGIIPDPAHTSVKHIMHRNSETERVYIDTYFVSEKWDGDIVNHEPEKCDDLSWYTLDALPENTIPYVKAALENIAQGKFYSEFGWE
ncbi:MAG: NUDIX domain-containing protein [Candidatus Moranbacteria bacterium]|nr:NUDIX domain-containing protein [Candidatus Moranbacteria bacterium]